jgi:hypothetical protein
MVAEITPMDGYGVIFLYEDYNIQWRRQASEFGGAFEGQSYILGGQNRIFKVLLFAHAVIKYV